MVKKIIACSDVHVRNLKRLNESIEMCEKFVSQCKKEVKNLKREEVRFVIAGDIFHNKLDISCEGYIVAAKLIKDLDKLGTTVIISGNHDLNMGNLSRLDPISTIFQIHKPKNTIFLDSELDYESGVYEDDNIVWCLYSSFDELKRPDIEEAKLNHPGKVFIGLFHGEVKSCRTDTGFVSDNGKDASLFDGLDFCIAGHIHRYQAIKYGCTDIVYCGSLIQQDFGENVSGHGYITIDIETNENGTILTHNHVELENKDYGYYTFSINKPEDLDDDIEKFINP